MSLEEFKNIQIKGKIRQRSQQMTKEMNYLSDEEISPRKETPVKIKSIIIKKEEPINTRKNLTDILDQMNFTKQNSKKKLESASIKFRQKIDELNLQFYIETEKYMNNETKDNKCICNLFSTLFQEINLYNEEIERLTNMTKGNNSKEILKTSKEFETKAKLIQSLKDSKKKIEEKLSNELEKNNILKIELESIKNENEYLKNILLQNNIKFESNHQQSHKCTDITQAESNNSIDFNNTSNKNPLFSSFNVIPSSQKFYKNFSYEKIPNNNPRYQPEIIISNLNEEIKNLCSNNNLQCQSIQKLSHNKKDFSIKKKLRGFINKDKIVVDLFNTNIKNKSLIKHKKS